MAGELGLLLTQCAMICGNFTADWLVAQGVRLVDKEKGLPMVTTLVVVEPGRVGSSFTVLSKAELVGARFPSTGSGNLVVELPPLCFFFRRFLVIHKTVADTPFRQDVLGVGRVSLNLLAQVVDVEAQVVRFITILIAPYLG